VKLSPSRTEVSGRTWAFYLDQHLVWSAAYLYLAAARGRTYVMRGQGGYLGGCIIPGTGRFFKNDGGGGLLCAFWC
jgi:hypothetical protein